MSGPFFVVIILGVGQVSKQSWSTFGKRRASEQWGNKADRLNHSVPPTLAPCLTWKLTEEQPWLGFSKGIQERREELLQKFRGTRGWGKAALVTSSSQGLAEAWGWEGYGLIRKGQPEACVTPSAPSFSPWSQLRIRDWWNKLWHKEASSFSHSWGRDANGRNDPGACKQGLNFPQPMPTQW